MTDAPLVSVITPTRNRARLLVETLDSVAAQTLPRWEHIVVDDGSDDGTAELMATRCADPRVRYIARDSERPGANVCRNIGARATAAPYLVFLDSDDLLAPACLKRRVAIIERNLDMDFITFQAGLFERMPGDSDKTANDHLTGDDLCGFLYFETPWQTTAPIWRRDSFLKLGGFDESLLSWQDVELHVRAICRGLSYLRFPDVDYFFRYVSDPSKISFAQRRTAAHLEAAPALIDRLEAHVRAGPGLSFERARALCSEHFFVAERWLEQRQLADALQAWRRARDRRLASRDLYLSGASLLRLAAAGLPVGRLIHKWKGWARLRSQPELVA